jgi:hypothetical protein
VWRTGRNIRAAAALGVVQAAAVGALLGAAPGVATAQVSSRDLVSVRSYSGQFIVYAARNPPAPPAALTLGANQSLVRLEPTLTAVSCERIKGLLLRELGATTTWSGTIYLVLYPARSPADTITIISEKSKNRWQYRVDCPDRVDRVRFVRGVVNALLLEQSNRTALTRAAEIPLWLSEGFTQLLLASNEAEIILPPPRATANGLNFSATMVKGRKQTLLEQAQKKLHGRPPLTFENLSWPAEDELAGSESELYSGSAQLFVGELLRLPDGPASLRAMLAQLPQRYNWQFAFLDAFHARFQRPLDVEKWWALSLTSVTGRNPTETWTQEESWQKLEQAIRFAAPASGGTNGAPARAEITLQTIIREWDPPRQGQALLDTLQELARLRPRIAQEFISLVRDYSRTLQTYLQQRDHPGSMLPFARRAARRRAVEAAVERLATLDAMREALRPAPKAVTSTQGPTPPAPAP